MKNNDHSYKNSLRILAASGFFALSLGTFMNIVLGADFPGSLIYPYTNTVTPIVNGGCTVLALFLIFFPETKWLFLSILFIQAIYDVLTGFYMLGVFLYSFAILMLFCWGWFKSYSRIKFISVCVFWFITLLTLFSFSWNDFLFALGISVFGAATYYTVYNILYDQLHFLIANTSVKAENPKVALPEKEGILYLANLNLTERQTACIHYTLETAKSYKEIAEILLVSESAIKRDMQDLYKIFGVKNRETLRLLLLQYKIVYEY